MRPVIVPQSGRRTVDKTRPQVADERARRSARLPRKPVASGLAAIVARELGIPAVVGCGNATMRLHTGDRVRVDGAAVTVEIVKAHELVSESNKP
jgi:phosphohistidine swiveling domain-containing protein